MIFGFAIENLAKTGLDFIFNPGLNPGAIIVPLLRDSRIIPDSYRGLSP